MGGYAGMTDEERQKLIARFKSHEVVMWTDIDLAAEEIERLAAENKELKKTLHHFLRERETYMGTAE
jgi:hypothetical protein